MLRVKRCKRILDDKWRLLNTERSMARYDHFLACEYGETLEVGPGSGFFTVLLQKERGVDDIVLLEKSHSCIKLLADMLKTNGISDVLVIEGDVNDTPFMGRCFDTIVCLEVLEHLINPYKALKEMARICRKDGNLYISCPIKGSMPPEIFSGHKQDFDFLELRTLIESTGWIVYKSFTDDTYQYFYSRRKC